VSQQLLNPAVDTRTANMAKRRERILAAAREIIAHEGIGALNVRYLAKKAGVTVPTIYNLIGKKTQILECLIDEMMEEFAGEFDSRDSSDALTMIEASVIGPTSRYALDEDRYRAALQAAEELDRTGTDTHPRNAVSAKAQQVQIDACIAAHAEGLTRGMIDPEVLGEQIYRGGRILWREWVSREITIDEFKNKGLLGVYVGLAADATPEFHTELIKRINALG
jgi:AcrR family transcriptional regulator